MSFGFNEIVVSIVMIVAFVNLFFLLKYGLLFADALNEWTERINNKERKEE